MVIELGNPGTLPMMRIALACLLLAIPAIVAAPSRAAAATLEAVKSRGQLVCGVNTGVAGFSAPDKQGVYRGLDIDYCRAVAAAVLGDADKVKFIPTTY